MITKNQSDAIKKFLDKEIDPAFARRARIILENLDIKGKEKILEVGCGRGFYEAGVSSIYPEVSIIGVDLNEKYLAVARESVSNKHVTFIRADATKLPFKDGQFDRVICSEVLEHIPDDMAVLLEIYRVLKPNGIVVITVPNKNYPFFWDPVNFVLERLFNFHIPSNIWWLAGIWADHVRLYMEEELVGKLGRAGKSGRSGFNIENIWHSTSFCFPFSHFILYGIGKNLVERGLVSGNFNRFSIDRKPSFLLRMVKFPFYSIDTFNEFTKSGKRYTNLIIKVSR